MLRGTAKRAARAATDLSQLPKVGEKLHGFTLLRTKHVPELELTALHLRHDKTGAEHLHIARDDSNNVFSIGFKTNPPDDTGVPHILEHTTLCGSEKSVGPPVQSSPTAATVLTCIDIRSATRSSRCCRALCPTS
jgi:hypothetical protein